MTPTHAFLGAACLFSGHLLAFAAFYYFAAAVFVLLVKRERRRFEPAPDASVSVLVPALHEGEALVACARSLLDQDHPGPVSIFLLVENEKDSAVPHLLKAFPRHEAEDGGAALLDEKNRELRLVYTGLLAKSAKLNAALARLRTDYVALLDADHLAHRSWLRTSIALSRETGARVVQARRWPLSASGMYRLWDSLQHHVGVQVLNLVYGRLGLSAQFTGTTAVFQRDVFAARRFTACITEDTELFYRLLSDGERVAFNPYSGSAEDLSPDLYSFVARRRRWSHGHTQAFFAHLRGVWRSKKAPARIKAQFLVHGQFYLAAVSVLGIHWAVGLFHFLQFPSARQAAVVLAAAAISAYLTARQRNTSWKVHLVDFGVGWAWAFPLCALAATLAMKAAHAPEFRYMIPFPYEKAFAGLCALGLTAPVLLVAVGATRLDVLSGWHFVAGLMCFPWILLLDVYGSLLGLFDWLTGMTSWKTISRSFGETLSDSHPVFTGRPAGLRYSVRPASFVWALLILLLPPALAHDYMYYETCGKGGALLERPFFDLRSSPLEFYTWSEKRRDGDRVDVTLTAEVIQSKPEREVDVEFLLDGKALARQKVTEDYKIVSARTSFPMGWETKLARARVVGKGFRCESAEPVSTSIVEVSSKTLLVNGEPFLVKGVVPSFSHPSMGVSLEKGYGLIKELGANAIRLYHPPTPEIRAAAEKSRLLVIDQAEASTWDNVALRRPRERLALRGRYQKLKEENRGFAYSLIHELGNELDLGVPEDEWSPALRELTRGLGRAAGGERPASYATHRVDADFPTAVRTYNMLDTGRHYWTAGLASAVSHPEPVLAGEFGGFLGAVEVLPSWYRTWRFERQWDALLSAGAAGGVFFESHDNWAQPRFKGITDPFTPDAPDDRRGIWEREGRAGMEADAVRDLYSDVALSTGATGARTRNRRPYRLTGVTARDASGKVWAVGDLAPGASAPLPGADLTGYVRFDYTTHRGLREVSWARLPAAPPALIEPVTGLEASLGGGPWNPFERAKTADGPVRLRFTLPPRSGAPRLLVLAGLRAKSVTLSDPSSGRFVTKDVAGLPYQEVLIDPDEVGAAAGPVEISFTRDLRREAYGRTIALEAPFIASKNRP